MQTITLPIAELKPALVGLGKVIAPKASLPILQHVKIERTVEGWIALTGTDLDRHITARLEQPAEGPPVAVLVPYEQLTQIAKNCGRNESIHIETGPEGTVIKFALADKTGESKVKPMPVSEFPATPRIKAEPIPLPSEFRTSIREAMDCASIDPTRFVLNGVFIDVTEPKANYVVATDGKHLYSANSFALPLKNSVLIPSHKFLGWAEFNKDGEWQMRADQETVQISSRRWRFISRQIHGKYPDWHVPIPNPTDTKTRIIIDPASLEKLITLIQRLPCHDERYCTLGLEWQKGQLLLLTKESPKDPWLRVPIQDAKGDGQTVTMFIDRRFFIKALSYGLNNIDIIDEMTAIRFHNAGKQMIVMPLREHADKPAAVEPASPPAEQPKAKPMQIQPPQAPLPAPTPTSIEDAIQMTLLLRDVFQDAVDKLKGLHNSLRQIQRDQKNSAKQFSSVRSRLQSLQTMRL